MNGILIWIADKVISSICYQTHSNENGANVIVNMFYTTDSKSMTKLNTFQLAGIHM